MKNYKSKSQKITNEIKANLLQNDYVITPQTDLKLNLLADLLNDYFTAKDIIKERGYLVTFNKGTTIANNPCLKVKYEAVKQINRILKDLGLNELQEESADDFINKLLA